LIPEGRELAALCLGENRGDDVRLVKIRQTVSLLANSGGFLSAMIYTGIYISAPKGI
jgi:hypothetical protein